MAHDVEDICKKLKRMDSKVALRQYIRHWIEIGSELIQNKINSKCSWFPSQCAAILRKELLARETITLKFVKRLPSILLEEKRIIKACLIKNKEQKSNGTKKLEREKMKIIRFLIKQYTRDKSVEFILSLVDIDPLVRTYYHSGRQINELLSREVKNPYSKAYLRVMKYFSISDTENNKELVHQKAEKMLEKNGFLIGLFDHNYIKNHLDLCEIAVRQNKKALDFLDFLPREEISRLEQISSVKKKRKRTGDAKQSNKVMKHQSLFKESSGDNNDVSKQWLEDIKRVSWFC